MIRMRISPVHKHVEHGIGIYFQYIYLMVISSWTFGFNNPQFIYPAIRILGTGQIHIWVDPSLNIQSRPVYPNKEEAIQLCLPRHVCCKSVTYGKAHTFFYTCFELNR